MTRLDFDDRVARGLQQYVLQVRLALGLRGECSYSHADEPAGAYLALDERLDTHPDRDVALLWDERHGWSAAVEDPGSSDLVVVAYFGQTVLPPPAEVAEWTANLFRARPDDNGPAPHVPGAKDVRRLLMDYAGNRSATGGVRTGHQETVTS
ncbi:DUF6292 family protein [Actinophytocola sp. NPDC049390]|uniref:DUF6292 family protein n=1 Tax=Actinophytocola sp. NPDC049390 TaxID=3363894 RepID=UPI00379CA954